MTEKRHPRPYLRDGVPGLPIEAQERLLREAGINLADAYVDRLSRTQIKRREAAALKQRAIMLQPTSRKDAETIYVAGLRVLGWTMADVARTLNAAGKRNANVHAVDIGKTFTATTLQAELLEALADAEDARRRGQTADARRVAVEVTRGRRLKATDAKMKRARELWPKLGEWSVAQISKEVGLSVTLLYRRLGPRETFLERMKKKHV